MPGLFRKLTSRKPPGLPSPAMGVAVVAVVIALGGTGYAATGLVSTGAKAASSTRGKTGPRGRTGKSGKAGPTGPQGPQGSRGSAGATGPKGTTGSSGVIGEITVVATATVTNGTFNTAVATCPSGFEAIGGGVDPNNVLSMVVTESTPRIDGNRPISTGAGQFGPANAWQGAALNNGATPEQIAVTVICAPTS